MEFIRGVKKVIEYIQKDIIRIKQTEGYADECAKIEHMITNMHNDVYKSMVVDINIYLAELDTILPAWKEIESRCNQLHRDFPKYKDLRYMYNRWLHIICDIYIERIIDRFPKYSILESVYDCNYFIEYLDATMPQVCIMNPCSKKFELTPIYKKLENIPRSIYHYDPNYKYSYNYNNGNTIYALLANRT